MEVRTDGGGDPVTIIYPGGKTSRRIELFGISLTRLLDVSVIFSLFFGEGGKFQAEGDYITGVGGV